MTALERNCGWLLAAYPRSYREERAEEMLGTLLEGPGRAGRGRPGGKPGR
jgi:hypothetical protein